MHWSMFLLLAEDISMWKRSSKKVVSFVPTDCSKSVKKDFGYAC